MSQWLGVSKCRIKLDVSLICERTSHRIFVDVNRREVVHLQLSICCFDWSLNLNLFSVFCISFILSSWNLSKWIHILSNINNYSNKIKDVGSCCTRILHLVMDVISSWWMFSSACCAILDRYTLQYNPLYMETWVSCSNSRIPVPDFWQPRPSAYEAPYFGPEGSRPRQGHLNH